MIRLSSAKVLPLPGRLPALMLLAVAAVGCGSIRSEISPPEYLSIEGKAGIDPVTLADKIPWALPFANPIKAQSSVAPDSAPVLDPAQRRLAAQARARRAALRSLAD